MAVPLVVFSHKYYVHVVWIWLLTIIFTIQEMFRHFVLAWIINVTDDVVKYYNYLFTLIIGLFCVWVASIKLNCTVF